jgi:hypothetical protein
MSASNARSESAAIFVRTRKAHAEHVAAKSELKLLVPDEAREHPGWISFGLFERPRS